MPDNRPDVSDWPGVEDRAAREALLQALADSVRFWTSHGSSLAEGVAPAYADKDEARAVEVLSDALQTDDQQQAFREVLRKCLSGLVHSTLVALDVAATRPAHWTFGLPRRVSRSASHYMRSGRISIPEGQQMAGPPSCWAKAQACG